jgi:alpha-galactosidase
MSPEIREILTNKEVIAVDQDALGEQGRRVSKNGDVEVWSRRLQDGSRAVVLFNRGKDSTRIDAKWSEIGYPDHLRASVHDLWEHKDLGIFDSKFGTTVPSHGVVMVAIRP